MRCLVALLVVFASSAPAHAASTRQLVTTLVVAPDEAPDYLCVVTRLSGRHSTPILDLKDAALQKNGARWTFRVPTTSPQIAKAFARNSDLEPALKSLGRPPDGSCENVHEGCIPGIRFFDEEKPGHITCARNRLGTTKEKVAVIGLRFHVQDRALDSVEFTGSAVTLKFLQEIKAEQAVFGAVLGGHYASRSEAYIGIATTMAMRLESRCSPSTVIIPPPAAKKNKVRVSLEVGKETPTCTATVTTGNAVTVQVPFDSENRVKSLSVAVGKTAFATRWTEPLPPAQFELGHQTIFVKWARHCLHPKYSCPTLKLVAAGGECSQTSVHEVGRTDSEGHVYFQEQCEYECGSRSDKPFVLPTRVRFEFGERSSELAYSWDDTVEYSEQVLSSFVAPEERSIHVAFDDPESWSNQDGDKLTDLEIRGANEQLHRINLPPRKSVIAVRVPGVSCDDRLAVRVRGDRRHEERNVELVGGRITVAPAEQQLEGIRLGVLLGGTMALPDLGYGEGARVEPQGVLGVYGAEPLARRMGRSWRRWQAEGEVSFDLTRMGYRVVRPAGEPGYADLGYATYYHATGLASLVYAWGRVRFGPGFGGGWGSPLVRGDRDVGSFNPFVAGVFLLRLRLAGDTWLEGSTAFRYLEKRYTFPTDFAGDPVPEPERRFVWLFLGGKVRFGP